jgi:LPS sulfotransferase NodH
LSNDVVIARSYVLASTPRVGSHLLGDALTSTRIAGHPREWLPRFSPDALPVTPRERFTLVTKPPSEAAYDDAIDGAYIRKVLANGTSENGVFGIVIHWFVFQDAVRRLQGFLDTRESAPTPVPTFAPHRVLAAAFPNLSYIWLKRRDKIAQAVSWYKAIQTGEYVGRHGNGQREREHEHEHEPVNFDYGMIRYLMNALTSFENAWASFFSSSKLTPLVLYYEDLSAHYDSSLRSVLDFLELDAQGVDIARPKREKYADARSREWIEQFKRLHSQARAAR